MASISDSLNLYQLELIALASDYQPPKSLQRNEQRGGIPKLVDIGIAPRGVIAIGLVPMGIVAIGAVSMGIFTIGAVGMGLVNACLVGCGLIVYGVKAMGMI